MTADRDCLEVFRAHHSAQAAASARVFAAFHYAGITYHIFAARSDHSQMNVVVTQLGSNGFLGLFGVFTPDSARVADADFAVVYPQVNGLFGFAFDDNGVKTGAFQFGSPEAAAFGFGNTAGHRRLGADAIARSTGEQ